MKGVIENMELDMCVSDMNINFADMSAGISLSLTNITELQKENSFEKERKALGE